MINPLLRVSAPMKKRILFFVAVVAVVQVVIGCDKNVQQKDAFVEKWKTAAEQSQGHSPTPEPSYDRDERNLKDTEGYDDVKALLERGEVDKPLPKMPISLDMRKAQIRSVLMALSSAANIAFVISPAVGMDPGDVEKKVDPAEFSKIVPSNFVTIKAEKKPWDEVFLSVLKTHRLLYSWEGDIIRIKSLEDIERDTKITAAKAQNLIQKQLLQRAEPRVTRVIKLQYMKSENAASIVNNVIFHNNTKLKTAKEKGDNKEGSVSFTLGTSEIETKPKGEGEAYGTGNVDKYLINVDGYAETDRESNSIIVHCARPMMKTVYYLIKKLDSARTQVKIKAYIIETDTNTARELGMRWGGIFQGSNSQKATIMTPSTGNVTTYQTGGAGPQGGTQTPGWGPGASGQGFARAFPLTPGAAAVGYGLEFMYGLIGGNILDVQLAALQTDNKIKILSSPSLTTLDNTIALTQDGFEVPFSVYNAQQGVWMTTWKLAVLSLAMLPHVIDKSTLRLNVIVKKDEVDRTLQDQAGNPYIRKKYTETEFVVGNGETIVISGLTRKRSDKSDNGIPFVKDIPVLGWVFKADQKGESQSEVLIFITPTILPGGDSSDMQKSLQQIEKELKEDGIRREDMYESMDKL